MSVFDRFVLLLSSPDEAMFDQYESPSLAHALIIVSAYALISSLNSFLSATIKSGSLGFSLVTFFGSFLTTYLTWAFLTIVFRLASELLGGLGELPNAVAIVGLAAAPLVLTSAVSIVITLGGAIALPNDPDLVLPKISLLVSVVGMAWGWPGILCYFGLKYAEKLHEAKAAIIVLLAFLAGGLYEVIYSGAFE
ncbi:MAG: YIP1 family protein [Ignavibacteriales bacterium]|nr:YIP1 family protein [Ignavibacteriales bacterium]